ncbi:hypothetical protein TrRE_jg10916 [Triparma retinervis]|uniref:Uncharacterized protein n=1 Tax=Triparma retinervis TaxID=2557542 RepID=A0A9W6ZEW5_9STRA|nr:hypothetical protein TrRE_jg10916 [Triparma retinervis]
MATPTPPTPPSPTPPSPTSSLPPILPHLLSCISPTPPHTLLHPDKFNTLATRLSSAADIACYLKTLVLIPWSENVSYPIVQTLASIMEGLLRPDSPTASVVLPLLDTISKVPVGKDYTKKSGLKKSFQRLEKWLGKEEVEWMEDKDKVREGLERCIDSLGKRWKETEGGEGGGGGDEGGARVRGRLKEAFESEEMSLKLEVAKRSKLRMEGSFASIRGKGSRDVNSLQRMRGREKREVERERERKREEEELERKRRENRDVMRRIREEEERRKSEVVNEEDMFGGEDSDMEMDRITSPPMSAMGMIGLPDAQPQSAGDKRRRTVGFKEQIVDQVASFEKGTHGVGESNQLDL